MCLHLVFPARSYQVLVEFGGPRAKPITLTEQHVSAMAAHLPGLCEDMCNNEHYLWKDDVLKLTTTGSYWVARFFLDRQNISFKLNELRYLFNVFHAVQNQKTLYTLALSDVLTYARAALSSPSYVAPDPNASKLILYEHLFDELKTVL